MALATTLTRQTSIFYTLASAYKVVLCARVQEPNAGDAKTGYDAAGAAGGFGGVLGRLRGGGDGMTQVGGQKHTVLARPHMPSTPPTFSLARACHIEPPASRKRPKTPPNPPAAPAAS